MEEKLQEIFKQSLAHRMEHECGAYPYEQAEMLPKLIQSTGAHKVLELGTGLGLTAAIMAMSSDAVHIETIDRDREHLTLARANWQKLGVEDKITVYPDKAEIILPQLAGPYDLIFFDGHVPSMKFLMQFERLLKKGGTLATANMFLRDQTGGKYMRALQKPKRWQVGVFADTAVAVKLFS